VNRLVTNGGTRCGEAVQEGFAAFFRRTGEEITFGGFEEFSQPGLRLGNAIPAIFSSRWCSYLSRQVFIAPVNAPGRHDPVSA
jgi:hypothetical protein